VTEKKMHRNLTFALIIGILIGLVPFAVRSALDAYVSSTAKRTAAECQLLSSALEHYRVDHGGYPPLPANIGDLEPNLVPTYLNHVPTRSFASGQPLVVVMHGGRAAIVATGRYGFVVENEHLVGPPPWQ
jgi:hypothetical protein